jgi:hypothetical protein
MQNTQRTTQLIGRAALAALLLAPVVGAQDRDDGRNRRDVRVRSSAERQLFIWRGTVDDDTRIYVRGENVQSRIVNGARRRGSGRVNQTSALPRREGIVRVELLEGRGRVDVIQQPNASNEYTAIVRIKDAQGGAASYRFITYFDPADADRRVRRGRVVETDVGGDVALNVGDPVFRWSGNVDGDLRIRLRRGQVGYDVLSGESPRNVRSNVIPSGLPRRDAQLSVAARQGRGAVTILQQPSSLNDYTAIIAVRDDASGFGYYDFDLIWR